MDGISNITGVRHNTIVIDDKKYHLKPKVLDDYAERESYICSLKPNPLLIIESLPLLEERPLPIMRANGEAMDAYNLRLAAHKRKTKEIDAKHEARQLMIDRAMIEASKPKICSFDDENAFDSSLHGIAWKFWRALREDHPEIDSVQAAMSLIEKAGTAALKDINAKLDITEEKDILKNSDGLEA